MADLRRELESLVAKVGNERVANELATMRQELAHAGSRAPVQLARVRVASPCKQRWDDMLGDDRVRVCAGCERPVFNLSEMTRDQAEAVLATRGITPCVRFYRRADGTVMTADCPTGERRGRRLAIVAGTTALLGASPAIADPAAPAPAVTQEAPDADNVSPQPNPTDAPADDAGDLVKTFGRDIEVVMGEYLEPEPPTDRPPIEWSTWLRGGFGMATQPTRVAARGIVQPVAEPETVLEGAIAADVSVGVARHGDLRLGTWAELRTTSGPVLGGELIVAGFPRHPSTGDFDGSGGLVLRAGGNGSVVTGAIGFGYTGSWSRTDPWISWARHAVGVRVVASMTRSSTEWSTTFGVELEPIGAVQALVGLVTD
jgi:hypothetical protein